MYGNFYAKQTTLTFLAQICPKRNLKLEIQKTNVWIRINILEIPCVPIFRQNGHLWLFGPKFAQKWILGSKFQKIESGFGINTSNIPRVQIFSQNGQLLIFRRKFGEIDQLRAIFWFKYCWRCCRKLGGDWNELGGGWVELVEVDGAGWSWVHALVIPKYEYLKGEEILPPEQRKMIEQVKFTCSSPGKAFANTNRNIWRPRKQTSQGIWRA